METLASAATDNRPSPKLSEILRWCQSAATLPLVSDGIPERIGSRCIGIIIGNERRIVELDEAQGLVVAMQKVGLGSLAASIQSAVGRGPNYRL